MIIKLGTQHLELKLYKVYINDDPSLALTYVVAISMVVRFNGGGDCNKVIYEKYLQQMVKFDKIFMFLKKKN